jgi:transposase
MDLRQSMIDACDRGMKTKQAVEAFGVAPSWVRLLKQHKREDGDIAPRPCGGSTRKLTEDDDAAIHDHFKDHPDTTIPELKEALDTDVSEITVWRAARRLGYRFTKSRSTPATATAKMS